MEGATAAAPQASVAAVHRTPRRPKDACRTCRKGKNACTATLAGSAVVVYFLLLLCFIISIAVLGFTASVGKYFLLIANAWRNGLGGLSLSLTLFAMIALVSTIWKHGHETHSYHNIIGSAEGTVSKRAVFHQ